MLAVLAVSCVFAALFSEGIFACNGLGFDGAMYGYMAINFESLLAGKIAIGQAFYHRIVPSGLAFFTLKGLGLAVNEANIIVFFKVLNSVCLLLVCHLWGRIADGFSLGPQSKWFGFIGLFVNHAVLKVSFYYPVLMDIPGLLLGMLLCWGCLEKRFWTIACVTVASLFIWPPAALMGMLMLFAPPVAVVPGRPWHRANLVLGGLVVAVSGFFIEHRGLLVYLEGHPWIGSPVTLAYLGIAFAALLRFRLPASLSRLDGRQVLYRVVALGIVGLALVQASTVFPFLPRIDWLAEFGNFATSSLATSIRRPGEFLVVHALYFGPVLFMLYLLVREYSQACIRLGLPFLMATLFIAWQFINPISRQMIAGLPVLVIPLVLAVDAQRLDRRFLLALGLVSLAYSKVWLTINAGADFGLPLEKQPAIWNKYTSAMGFHMDGGYLIVQAALSAAVVAWLWRHLRGQRGPERAKDAGNPSHAA